MIRTLVDAVAELPDAILEDARAFDAVGLIPLDPFVLDELSAETVARLIRKIGRRTRRWGRLRGVLVTHLSRLELHPDASIADAGTPSGASAEPDAAGHGECV